MSNKFLPDCEVSFQQRQTDMLYAPVYCLIVSDPLLSI